MRFRLGTGSQQTQNSFDSGFKNLFMAPLFAQQAQEEGQALGLKRQLAESQIASHVADAALKGTKASSLASAPDVFSSIIAANAGSDVPTLNSWRDQVRTGRPAQTMVPGDPMADAPVVDAPVDTPVDPKVAARLLTQFQRFAPALVNPEDVKMGDVSTAAGHYQTQDLLDRILAGQQNPGLAGQAVAASKGNKLVDNIGDTGDGFNVFTGAGTTLSPALRILFGDKVNAQVLKDRAAAGNSSASAGLSNARRERVVGGYDKPTTIVDEDTGEASVTRLPTGDDPVTVGVAPKKQGGVEATNAKERNRVTTAVEKELVGAPDAEIAAEVERRMARRNAGKAPAAAPATPAPSIDMAKANEIKAKVKAGTLPRAQGLAQLQALGFK